LFCCIGFDFEATKLRQIADFAEARARKTDILSIMQLLDVSKPKKRRDGRGEFSAPTVKKR
jgi:hypothetical protein